MEVYQVGDLIAKDVTFRDEAGTLVTPSARVAHVVKPDGTTVAITPTVQSVGVLRVTHPAFDQHGIWRGYCAGTAGIVGAEDWEVYVKPYV